MNNNMDAVVNQLTLDSLTKKLAVFVCSKRIAHDERGSRI